MIKVEALTLEEAFKNAALELECSVTELKVEVIQYPQKGMLGLFKKNAIIVATHKNIQKEEVTPKEPVVEKQEAVREEKIERQSKPKVPHKTEEKKIEPRKEKIQTPQKQINKTEETPPKSHKVINDTIMPASFVSDQDDYEDDFADIHYTADYDDEYDNNDEAQTNMSEIARNVAIDINKLFDKACFNIDTIDVSVYDENTLLVEFRGEDAALLIGKEGYRYKALSYMIFNWINAKYQVQLRLEIAEFLKNQEEFITRYLINVCEIIEKEGRAQTKILDGVLIQIALRELREKYPEKYVVIRSTRDGLKYIIVNDYHTN